MGVNYVHLINYMCPYNEGQISFSLNVDLEKKEKVSDFSELCSIIKSFGEEGIEASGYYVSSVNQEDHKQIIRVKCLDGLTIQPVFEEPKAKVLTRAAATTPKSVSVLNAPAVLSDTVNDKLVTLSGLAKFKEKCDSSYMKKTTIFNRPLFRYNIMIANLKGFTGVAEKDLQISFELFAREQVDNISGGSGGTETFIDFFERYKTQEGGYRPKNGNCVASGNYKGHAILGVRLGTREDPVLHVLYKSQNTRVIEEFVLDLGSSDYYMWFTLEPIL